MQKPKISRLALTLVAVAGLSVTVGLGTAAAKRSGSDTSSSALKIAFVMPCSTCASRFEQQDKPDFIKAVHKLNPKIKVIADNAQGSDATQISQVEDALANGAKVIVISPLDTAVGKAVVSKAARQHVPVIAYDGLLTGAKIQFYVSFDNTKVGKMQGNFLLHHVATGGTIALINGDQTSAPGVQFKKGALSVLNPAFHSGRLKNGYSADTKLWDPSLAQTEMQQALTKLNDNVKGVLSPNDGIAGGVIAALKSQHLDGKVVVTGQDATTQGLQYILEGEQSMTVFKPIVQEASVAAKVAVGLAEKKKHAVTAVARTKVGNGAGRVPSVLLQPIVVTKANMGIVVKDGGGTWSQICSGIPASLCPKH